MRRIVITGMGIVSSIGTNVEEFWKNLCDSKSGIRLCTKIDMTPFKTKLAAEVDLKTLTLPYLMPYPLDDVHIFALTAAHEAVTMAGLDFDQLDPYNVGISVGTTLGGMNNSHRFHKQWLEEGYENADASLLYTQTMHSVADLIGETYGVTGPKMIISTSCSAGAGALGYALDTIRAGTVDVMIAGGADLLTDMTIAGFHTLDSFDTKPCSPLSRSAGITLGEGAGFLVLEEEESAQKRGAKIFAEFVSYGSTVDAFHATAPDLGGFGATKAMIRALVKAGLKPTDVSYVNGHATGTAANDLAEPKAFRRVFQHHLANLNISGTKAGTGHCLGATGAMEAVISVLAIRDSTIPPTINFSMAHATPGFNYTPNIKVERECNVVMSNSFAFGGNNCSLLIAKQGLAPGRKQPPKKKIVISGVGCVSPAGADFHEFSRNIKTGQLFTQEITEFDTAKYVSKSMGKCVPVDC